MALKQGAVSKGLNEAAFDASYATEETHQAAITSSQMASNAQPVSG
jgi:hypothetical protein